MNTQSRYLTSRHPTQGADNGVWTHTLIWALLVVAAMLLVGFIAVVNDITERGELRRVQQRASGTFAPLEGTQTGSADGMRLLSMADGKPEKR